MADHDSSLPTIAAALKEARSVVIGAHVDPDGDAIGSVLGLTLACDLAGIPATPVFASSSAVPGSYGFLPSVNRFRRAAMLEAPDVFVALDTPSFARLGEAEPLAHSAGRVIVIDHHPDNARLGAMSYVDPTAASTGSIIWNLLPWLRVAANSDIATCLYTALLTDTGRFSYQNTSPEALRTAAAMVERGVNVQQVFTHVYENRSAGALALIGRTLSRITCVQAGSVAYSWVSSDDFTQTGARPEETENLIDQVRSLGGVKVVFLMKSSGDSVRVSLRAKADADVGHIARSFGGGGHKAAAGFTWSGEADTLLPVLLQRVKQTLS